MLHGDELWFMFIETKINIINHAMPLSNHCRWHVYHSTKRAGSWHCWTPTFMDLADLASKFASKSCQKWEDHGGLEATHTIADLFRVRLLAYWMVKMVKGLIFFKVDLTGISWIFLGFPKVSQQNFLDLDAVKNGLLYPMISDQWWIFRTMFENTGGYPPRDRKCRIVLSDMGLRLVDNLPVLFAIGNPWGVY